MTAPTVGIFAKIDPALAHAFDLWLRTNNVNKATAIERAIAKLIGRKPPPERQRGRPRKEKQK